MDGDLIELLEIEGGIEITLAENKQEHGMMILEFDVVWMLYYCFRYVLEGWRLDLVDEKWKWGIVAFGRK